MKSLEGVDRWLGRQIERWTSNLTGGPHPKEALEIRREILTAVRERIEPKGGGEYLFPYGEVLVHLASRDDAQRDSFLAAFVDEGGLERDVRELLNEAHCRADEVTVTTDIVDDAAADPLRLEFKRIAKTNLVASAPARRRPAAWLHVTKGKTDQAEFFIGKDTVYLGRLKEVSEKDGALRRRNDVAFDDAENTVSREHAHIRFEDGKFRLFHDGGERETRLFREGRAVPVPATGMRGTQLRSGDEIHLGDARLRFETGE